MQEDVLLEGSHGWAIPCITSPITGAYSRYPINQLQEGWGQTFSQRSSHPGWHLELL